MSTYVKHLLAMIHSAWLNSWDVIVTIFKPQQAKKNIYMSCMCLECGKLEKARNGYTIDFHRKVQLLWWGYHQRPAGQTKPGTSMADRFTSAGATPSFLSQSRALPSSVPVSSMSSIHVPVRRPSSMYQPLLHMFIFSQNTSLTPESQNKQNMLFSPHAIVMFYPLKEIMTHSKSRWQHKVHEFANHCWNFPTCSWRWQMLQRFDRNFQNITERERPRIVVLGCFFRMFSWIKMST